MTIDLDDMGANKIISPECQSHDCRDKLDELHYANPNFKVTLFAIPAYMTLELADWCRANGSWVELAVHGYNHSSNWECADMSFEEFEEKMNKVRDTWPDLFVQGFKAPGWQISDGCYRWLADNGWWVADQEYNNGRRPKELKAYTLTDGGNAYRAFKGRAVEGDPDMPLINKEMNGAWHGHTWDCVGNGIYERFDEVKALVEKADNFQFVSEVLS